jgi:GTP-binding protein HflX
MQKRIGALKREIRQIERQHHTQASGRREYFGVSLVGYTNAGKSTLLRSLTGAETLIEDKLFATLDTTTRAWELPDGKRVFLSDTVGFIRGLPHHLVASFHATLEEAREADLLFHVVDSANPDARSQMAAVRRVLDEVGAGKVPSVTVLNKVDALADRMALQLIGETNGPVLSVSAKTGEGLEDLAAAVMEYIERSQVEVELTAHPGDGRLLAFLAEKGRILEQEYPSGEEVRIRALLPKRYAEALPGDAGEKEDWED